MIHVLFMIILVLNRIEINIHVITNARVSIINAHSSLRTMYRKFQLDERIISRMHINDKTDLHDN